jgi:hypothetical protein
MIGELRLTLAQFVFQIVEHLIAVADRQVTLQATQRHANNIAVMELGADAFGIA